MSKSSHHIHSFAFGWLTPSFNYMSKSIEKGFLSLGTHNLNSIEFLNYKNTYFIEKAAKIKTEIKTFEIYEAINAQNVVVLGEDCSSIDFANDYTQGGDHSILSFLYGLNADQVFEGKIVTAQGQHFIATSDQNSDLYGALCGERPEIYEVVVSFIIRTHLAKLIGGANLTFTFIGISNDTYGDVMSTE